MMADAAPYILTVTFPKEVLDFFTRLRTAHFPPERNFLEAHLTLFHHLPLSIAITDTIREVCTRQTILPLTVSEVVSIGRGTAYRIISADLVALHSYLQQQWRPWLIPQDRQRLRPHITVQNKVPATAAASLRQQLQSSFVPFEIHAVGLTLWEYCGGPWKFAASFAFKEK